MNVLGAFTVNTDILPGAEQLSEIREVIEHEKVSCVFSEPQFNPDIIKAVAKDTNIKTGVIDPLGATLNPGKTLYFDLIMNIISDHQDVESKINQMQKISYQNTWNNINQKLLGIINEN